MTKKEIKYCPKCETDKEANDFSKSTTKADGLASYCKECRHSYYIKSKQSTATLIDFSDLEEKIYQSIKNKIDLKGDSILAQIEEEEKSMAICKENCTK